MGPREVLAASFLSSLGEFVTRVSLPTRCATQTHVVMITLCIHSGHSSGSGRLSFLAICTAVTIVTPLSNSIFNQSLKHLIHYYK